MKEMIDDKDYPYLFDGKKFEDKPYNENHVDTFTKSANKTNTIAEVLVFAGCFLIIGLSLTVAHYRAEVNDRDRTIKIQEATIKRLEGTVHNPFVHARK